jgi:hypothetical protein
MFIPDPEPEFLTFKEAKNRFQGTNSARLCRLAGRYDNPIPNRFQAPIDCLKIPALDPVANNNKAEGRYFVLLPFFKAEGSQNSNYFILQQVQKKFEPTDGRILVLFTQNIATKLSDMGWRSGIREK